MVVLAIIDGRKIFYRCETGKDVFGLRLQNGIDERNRLANGLAASVAKGRG